MKNKQMNKKYEGGREGYFVEGHKGGIRVWAKERRKADFPEGSPN